MSEVHAMSIEDDDGDDIIFVCREEDCGRRVMMRRSGGFVVLQRGDFFARHSGSNVGAAISMDLRE